MSKQLYWVSSTLISWGVSFDLLRKQVKDYERTQRSLVNLANDPNFSKEDLQEILRRLPDNPDAERDDEGQTLALIASRQGLMELLNELIKRKADITRKSSFGWNTLHLASLAGWNRICEILIEAASGNARIDFPRYLNEINRNNGWNALHIAVSKGNVSLFEYLLKKGADFKPVTLAGETLLIIASCNGFTELVKRCIQLGIDVNAKTTGNRETALLLACSNNHFDIAKFLLEHNADPNITSMNGSVPLHSASLRASPELVQLLIDKKADVNAAKSDGFTALHCSGFKNRDDIISLLLKFGAKPDAESKFGRTALHEAVFDGNSKAAEALLKGGASPNAKDNDGLSPLHTCCQMHGKKGEQNFLKCCELLIQHGADANLKDDYGCTPLHSVCCTADRGYELLELLLKNGGDPTIESLQGWSPLHNAYHFKSLRSVELLENHIKSSNNSGYLATFDKNKEKTNVPFSRASGAESKLTPDERSDVLRGDVSLEGEKLRGKFLGSVGIAKRIKEGRSKNIIVLTGAGISVNAGIPDFRSPGSGIYSQSFATKYNLPNPMAAFDPNFIRVNPRPFFAIVKEHFLPVMNGIIKPTKTHKFIKLLHDKGILLRNYTQNIDALERVVGVPKEKMVESHGTFASARCMNCSASVSDMRDYWRQIADDLIPMCAECGLGVCRPDVVFFGEALPTQFTDNKFQDFEQCDLLIVIGTSLVVYPFAGLVNEVKPVIPRLLINKESVGAFRRVTGEEAPTMIGNYRDVAFIGNCDEGVNELAQLLGWKDELENIK